MKSVDTDLKAQPFELLFPQDRIEKRIRELGQRISRDYAGKAPVFLGVLKGSFVFLADLIRVVTVPSTVEFVSAHSFRPDAEAGNFTLLGEPHRTLKDCHVLMVEGIVDTGQTAHAILAGLRRMQPASIEIVTLLNKVSRRQVDVNVKYSGFEVGEDFVIGYGLDHGQLYRNLPFIGKVIKKKNG